MKVSVSRALGADGSPDWAEATSEAGPPKRRRNESRQFRKVLFKEDTPLLTRRRAGRAPGLYEAAQPARQAGEIRIIP
jgi:hypothetical protein